MDPGLRATGDRVHTKKVRRGKQGGKLLGVFKESSKFERRKAKQRAKRAALKAIADQSGGLQGIEQVRAAEGQAARQAGGPEGHCRPIWRRLTHGVRPRGFLPPPPPRTPHLPRILILSAPQLYARYC